MRFWEHPEWPAMVRAARTNPDEDTIRLAMADIMEECAAFARAEFVRRSVEYARLPKVVTLHAIGPVEITHRYPERDSIRNPTFRTILRTGRYEATVEFDTPVGAECDVKSLGDLSVLIHEYVRFDNILSHDGQGVIQGIGILERIIPTESPIEDNNSDYSRVVLEVVPLDQAAGIQKRYDDSAAARKAAIDALLKTRAVDWPVLSVVNQPTVLQNFTPTRPDPPLFYWTDRGFLTTVGTNWGHWRDFATTVIDAEPFTLVRFEDTVPFQDFFEVNMEAGGGAVTSTQLWSLTMPKPPMIPSTPTGRFIGPTRQNVLSQIWGDGLVRFEF